MLLLAKPCGKPTKINTSSGLYRHEKTDQESVFFSSYIPKQLSGFRCCKQSMLLRKREDQHMSHAMNRFVRLRYGPIIKLPPVVRRRFTKATQAQSRNRLSTTIYVEAFVPDEPFDGTGECDSKGDVRYGDCKVAGVI
jgi:hypothetical protein